MPTLVICIEPINILTFIEHSQMYEDIYPLYVQPSKYKNKINTYNLPVGHILQLRNELSIKSIWDY